MSLLFVCFLWFVGAPFVYGTDCPNHEFEFVAEYRERFRLNKVKGTGGRYWVAFGSNGAWAINLVDAKFGDKAQTFKCKENYWGKIIGRDKGSEDKPICCVAHHEIDNSADETNPFAVLPSKEFTQFEGHSSPTKKTKWDPSYGTKYHWIFHIYGGRGTKGPLVGSGHEWFYGWTPIKITETLFDSDFFTDVIGSHFEFDPLPDFNDKAEKCQPVESGTCDTGITSHIVAFHVQCDGYSYVKFGFKTNGIFEAQYLKCLGDKNGREILYYPVSELFREDKAPSYNSLQLGWRLGSFCASCPSTSFKKVISETEAKMNKKRLQHSLAISAGRSFIGKRLGINVKYVRTWFKEAAETLTSGSGTTISATCNGFYLWYWTVSVGTWGEGSAEIPTQFFYCTDRTTPPICSPKIAEMEGGGDFGRLCNGHDVDADFMEGSDDTSNQWQSMHSGRPKPVRLQGQRYNEPGFYTTHKKPTLPTKTKRKKYAKREQVSHVRSPHMSRTVSRTLVDRSREPPPVPQEVIRKIQKSKDMGRRPHRKLERAKTSLPEIGGHETLGVGARMEAESAARRRRRYQT